MSKFKPIIAAILVLLLVGSCASPPICPAPSRTPQVYGYYYVTPGVTNLRESPGYAGNVLEQLYQGERVARLDGYVPGWRQVRSQRSGLVGWVQESGLSPNAVSVKYYYVTKETLALRECPREDCSSRRLLYQGDQVQKVGENEQGWWRVLVAKGHSLGWVPASAMSDRLKPAQVKKQGGRTKRVRRDQKTPPKSKETTPPEKPEEASGEPLAM